MSWENFGGRKPLSFVKNNAASSRGASGAASDVAKAFLPALAVAASLASETNVKTVSGGFAAVCVGNASRVSANVSVATAQKIANEPNHASAAVFQRDAESRLSRRSEVDV